MTTRGARLTRGWVTALVAVFVAAFAHSVAGGSPPGLLGSLLAVVFSGLISTSLAGKTLSLIRMSASVVVSQFIFHALFGLGATSGISMTVVTGSHHPAVAVLRDAGAGTGSMGMLAQAADQMEAWMWLAHVGAALVTIIALRHGEASYWALFTLAVLLASCLNAVWRFAGELVPVAVRCASSAMPRNGNRACTDFGTLRSALWRRGPPSARPAF